MQQRLSLFACQWTHSVQQFVRAPVNRENFFNCSCYRKRRGKVSSMSSFNSWLIIVSLLYNVFLYRSSARPTYPPSGEFLHQVNLFYRYLKITDCASFAVFPERQASALNALYNKLHLIWFRLRMPYAPENIILPSQPKGISQIFFKWYFFDSLKIISHSIVFKHLRKLSKCSCKFVFCRVWRVYAETRNTWIAGPRIALRGKGKK